MFNRSLVFVSLLILPPLTASAQPVNDACANAIPIMNGMTPYSNVGATTDGPNSCANNQDIWFIYTATNTGDLIVSLCGSGYDTYAAVYDYSGACPPGAQLACNDDSCNLQSMVTVPVQAGVAYLLRIGGFAGGTGSGQIDLSYVVTPVSGVACSAAPGTAAIDISWTNPATYQEINIFVDGVPNATIPGTSTQHTVTMATTGSHTVCVEAVDATLGAGPQICCTVLVVAGCTATDYILALEAPSQVDSAGALLNALNSAGLSVSVFNTPPIDSLPCLDLAQRVWVMGGTFPEDYRINQAEGDFLANLASLGIAIYFESGDHWGFQHVGSALDARDGVGAAADGDDSFTAMNGQLAAIAGLDLSGFVSVTYNQDQAANDWTDRLTVAGPGGADAVTSAEAIWTSTAGGYNTGIIAIHNDGATMISASFEFGGFGGDQQALAMLYLAALGGTGAAEEFVRGNCNDDASVNLVDAVFLLGFLFPVGPPNTLVCRDACDANDDGGINLVDVVAILNALFGQPPISLPGPSACAADPTTTDTIDCAAGTACP
ncbi:MAG: hypothetical protein AB7O52_00050 [Planctomycetota bacterium]